MHAPLCNVRVHSPASSHAGLVVWFFQFAACYEAHLPSVTVRDENAAGPNALSTSESCTAHRQTVWPAWDDDDAMHRDVCRQKRRNTVHSGHLPETAATSGDEPVEKEAVPGTHVRCSVLFSAVNRECMQVPAQASPPLEAT
jgi:hypothetical protein